MGSRGSPSASPVGPFSRGWLVERLMRASMASAAGLAGGRLLDVGCGRRPYYGLLSGRVSRYVGLERSRERYASSTIDVWGDGCLLPFAAATFQTVVCNQVLEHVPEPGRLMDEVARVLAPGGVLILTAPQIWGLHEVPHDYYRFTPYGLSHLATRSGLQTIEVKPIGGFWACMGMRLAAYLGRFERGAATCVVRALYPVVHLLALGLDRAHFVPGDAWNHLLLARKAPA